MTAALVIALFTMLTALIAGAVIVLSHHKKACAADIKLLGRIARVDRRLDPEGTVLVSGELWRAKSITDLIIPSHSQVQVVGFRDHLLLVKVCR